MLYFIFLAVHRIAHSVHSIFLSLSHSIPLFLTACNVLVCSSLIIPAQEISVHLSVW